ncbi:MAG TPA: hypothetical protein VK116_18370, partial [Planctomycetota bacterium]|nr:hypothetical protein [Planctomycetota bacterium]
FIVEHRGQRVGNPGVMRCGDETGEIAPIALGGCALEELGERRACDRAGEGIEEFATVSGTGFKRTKERPRCACVCRAPKANGGRAKHLGVSPFVSASDLRFEQANERLDDGRIARFGE